MQLHPIAGSLALLVSLLAGSGTRVASTSGRNALTLAGTWEMQGTGPSGLVNAGGRIATLWVRQHGQTLTIVLQSGGRRYAAAGAVHGAALSFTWRMPAVGPVRYSGTVQVGGARVIGQWADGHGADGGAILTRVLR